MPSLSSNKKNTNKRKKNSIQKEKLNSVLIHNYEILVIFQYC